MQFRHLFLYLIAVLFVTSCARVGSPVGGAKDTIAPVMIRSNIDTARVNVPRDLKELRLDFDEYITLKDINKNLIISPPLKRITKILPSGTANKFLLIRWTDTLQANTTYNFNFGNSIVDNNEGNALQYYNFAFSTGPKLDELFISGEAKSLFPAESSSANDAPVVVGLYKAADTVNYRQKPYYITKADPDGYFELNYLSPGDYRLLAFRDDNGNSVYDPGKEQVAFLKKNITLQESISGLKVNLAPSRKVERYSEMKEMPGGILMLFEGNPAEVKVTALNPKLREYKVLHRPKSDSVTIWFDARNNDLSTGSENLRFSYNTGKKQDTVSIFYRYNPTNAMTVTNARGNLLPPQADFVFTSNYAVDKIQPEKWQLVSDSTIQAFQASLSKDNPFEVRIGADFKEGKKYQLTVPKETVSSFYETLAKSYRFDFEADKAENYGSLTLTLENAPTHKFWLELLSNGRVMYSRYGTENVFNFAAIKPDSYQLRILVDNDENGVWDAADLQTETLAEDIYVFEKKVEIRPLWEIRETWRLPSEAEAGTTLAEPKVK